MGSDVHLFFVSSQQGLKIQLKSLKLKLMQLTPKLELLSSTIAFKLRVKDF